MYIVLRANNQDLTPGLVHGLGATPDCVGNIRMIEWTTEHVYSSR